MGNGSPTKEFKPKRELSQGKPLAPFLFLVAAEGLAGLVRKTVKSEMLKGVRVNKLEVGGLMYAQFADDKFFMCEVL